MAPHAHRAAPAEPMQKVDTPGLATCEQVATLLHLPLGRTVKCIMLNAAGKVHMLLIRGDHTPQRSQDGQARGTRRISLGKRRRDRRRHRLLAGLPRPRGHRSRHSAHRRPHCRGDERFHLRRQRGGFSPARREFRPRLPRARPRRRHPQRRRGRSLARRKRDAGHRSPASKSVTSSRWARTTPRRWAPPSSTPVDSRENIEMGCYGIGITRVVAAAIEQNYDERGIIWPAPLAPLTVAIAPIGFERNETVRSAALALHDELAAAGIDVLLDDRGERPGVMFADLELIGIPHPRHRRRAGIEGRQGRIPGAPRHGTDGRARSGNRGMAAHPIAALNSMNRVAIRARKSLQAVAAIALVAVSLPVRAGQPDRGGARRQLWQNSLHRSVSDYPAPRLIFATDAEGWAWLADMSSRLAPKMPDWPTRRDFLITVQYEATRARARSSARARPDTAREQLPEVRRLERRCAGIHAGDCRSGCVRSATRATTCSRCEPICATAAPFFATTSTSSRATCCRALGRYNGSLGRPE